MDIPANLETWIGHPQGLRLRKHPKLAAARLYLAEYPMVIRIPRIIEASSSPASRGPSLKIETLPVFRRSTVGLTVEIRAEVDFPSSSTATRLTKFTFMAGRTEIQEFAVLQPGKRQYFTFPFPEFDEPVVFISTMEIRDEGKFETVAALLPEKKWTSYVAFQTHIDLGWTDRAAKVAELLRKMTGEDAVRICKQFAGNPEGQRFVWTCECSEALRLAWDGSDAERRRELVGCIEHGLIESCVLPYSFHTNLMSRDLLKRSILRSFELRREMGVESSLDLSVAQQNDVPGHTWVMPDILAEAGVRRAVIGHNWLVRGCPLPPLFRWRGPDGGEVLTLATSCVNYGGNAGIPSQPEDLRGLSLNSKEGVKVAGTALFNAITYGENCGPAFADAEISKIQKWQEQFEWPRIHIGSPKDYFNHIESEIDVSKLPVIDKEIGDWWLDGPASMPVAMGQFRRAQKVFSQVKEPRVSAAMEDELLLFAEHTFGLNAQLVKVQAAEDDWKIEGKFGEYVASWEDKEAYAQKAWNLAEPNLACVPAPVASACAGAWALEWDDGGIKRLVDPNGHCWVDAAKTPKWPRLGTLVQRFVPRETGSWLHHDFPFAPNQGSRIARVDSVKQMTDGPCSSVEIAQRLETSAGEISQIVVKWTAREGDPVLHMHLSIRGKVPTAQSEALGLALPWCAKAPAYCGESGGRILRVDKDQMEQGNRDMHAFGDGWILGDGSSRLAVSSPDVFLWHFGGFRHCDFNRTHGLRTGETYAHLFNNAWQTNFRIWIGGDLDYDFFLRPLDKDEDPVKALSSLSAHWLLP